MFSKIYYFIGVDPKTGKIVPGGIVPETHQALLNIGSILKSANVTYINVVKTTVLLANINDFDAMNKVYATFFTDKFPTRTTFQVSEIPLGARVAIECMAVAGILVDITPALDKNSVGVSVGRNSFWANISFIVFYLLFLVMNYL
jgi:2-iminobutanoate/2-iminopropanoate deaminase